VSRILVVDDEPSICWGITRMARAMGLRVDSASSAEQGLAMAAAARPHVLVLDVRLPGVDGLTAMEAFRRHIGDAPIIVMTAFGDLNTAVNAVAKGAFEYLVKPFDLAEIRAAVERALRSIAAPSGLQHATPAAEDSAVDGMLGESAIMRAVFKQLALAASSDAPVLLEGECGVGKEMAARAIHRHSARGNAPFVAVHLAALHAADVETELFGRDADATGGASGLLAGAAGGTLFLDDVAELSPPMQARLVQWFDQVDANPRGSAPARRSVRVISATRRHLRAAAQAGEFRNDLLLRLATYSVVLPPLRERREDIPLLARRFASQLQSAAVLADDVLAELVRRPWHGNVRELKSAIEHALVVARSGLIVPAHLPAPLAPPTDSTPGDRTASLNLGQAVAALANSLLEDPAHAGGVYDRFLEEVERPLFAAALSQHGNRCAPAARVLGLHRTTLKRKLDQYGLDEGPSER
jgi:two-component system nitrogen regulation response regulator GlnG